MVALIKCCLLDARDGILILVQHLDDGSNSAAPRKCDMRSQVTRFQPATDHHRPSSLPPVSWSFKLATKLRLACHAAAQDEGVQLRRFKDGAYFAPIVNVRAFANPSVAA